MTYDKRRIEKSQYVLGVKPRTLGAPIAAQAGDEPMQDAEIIASFEASIDNEVSFKPGDISYWVTKDELLAWFRAISPRATADVERDAARYRWLREQPYSDWKRIAFNTMDDHPFAIRCRDEEIDAAIATTKPGA